jgi:hypothetical protein
MRVPTSAACESISDATYAEVIAARLRLLDRLGRR